MRTDCELMHVSYHGIVQLNGGGILAGAFGEMPNGLTIQTRPTKDLDGKITRESMHLYVPWHNISHILFTDSDTAAAVNQALGWTPNAMATLQAMQASSPITPEVFKSDKA